MSDQYTHFELEQRKAHLERELEAAQERITALELKLEAAQDHAASMEQSCRELEVKLLESVPIAHCTMCPDVGWYCGGIAEEPEQIQCEFCYTVPNSAFNLSEVIAAHCPLIGGEG